MRMNRWQTTTRQTFLIALPDSHLLSPLLTHLPVLLQTYATRSAATSTSTPLISTPSLTQTRLALHALRTTLLYAQSSYSRHTRDRRS